MISAGFLPPISMISGRGNGRAALSRSSFIPTAIDPVNTRPSTPGLSEISCPTGTPGPFTRLKTPGGSMSASNS